MSDAEKKIQVGMPNNVRIQFPLKIMLTTLELRDKILKTSNIHKRLTWISTKYLHEYTILKYLSKVVFRVQFSYLIKPVKFCNDKKLGVYYHINSK